MVVDEQSYYQHRVEAEVERARQATLPAAALAHSQLAEAYRNKLAGFERDAAKPA